LYKTLNFVVPVMFNSTLFPYFLIMSKNFLMLYFVISFTRKSFLRSFAVCKDNQSFYLNNTFEKFFLFPLTNVSNTARLRSANIHNSLSF
jgi:hypothetical protein